MLLKVSAPKKLQESLTFVLKTCPMIMLLLRFQTGKTFYIELPQKIIIMSTLIGKKRPRGLLV